MCIHPVFAYYPFADISGTYSRQSLRADNPAMSHRFLPRPRRFLPDVVVVKHRPRGCEGSSHRGIRETLRRQTTYFDGDYLAVVTRPLEPRGPVGRVAIRPAALVCNSVAIRLMVTTSSMPLMFGRFSRNGRRSAVHTTCDGEAVLRQSPLYCPCDSAGRLMRKGQRRSLVCQPLQRTFQPDTSKGASR
jgi:hypothetical protein